MRKQVRWSSEQRRRLKEAIQRFKVYSKTEAYHLDLQERDNRKFFFQQVLPKRLAQLSEADIEEIVGMLWAHRMWGNKAYVARDLVEDNGLPRLRQALQLLYTLHDDPEEAYERFLSLVKHWGPAAVTEMLAYIYPERCGLWNKQARTALEILGFSDQIPVKKYRLTKQEYRVFNNVLQSIAEELRGAGIQDVDLLIVDFFLYHIVNTTKEVSLQVPQPTRPDFDHDEIRDLIADIGRTLGFDADTEVLIARGARVDVVWRARIGNLGMVTYVFEVHRSGSIDSLILNLQKALNAPSVQKVIAVSDAAQLKRIQEESAELPEQFRRALRFWDVAEVVEAAHALERAMSLIGKLGLMERREYLA